MGERWRRRLKLEGKGREGQKEGEKGERRGKEGIRELCGNVEERGA